MYAILSGVLVLATGASAKPTVAWTDRAAWPEPISTAAQFDLASRAELLVYVEAFLAALAPSPLARGEGPSPATARWRSSREVLLLQNFQNALKTCEPGALLCPPRAPATWSELSALAQSALQTLPAKYEPWREEARSFHAKYVRELLRLALLWDRTSSEILPVAESEEFGESFADCTFLLTFDDGPTGAAGETDRVLALMREREQHAVFFSVGAAMHARRSISGLYDGQCLASHGMEHESHVTSPRVAAELAGWNEELSGLQAPGTKRWFRPPYGQRTATQVQQLERDGVGVMLWNIDSQDWQAPKDSMLVAGRVLTLMLLWRRGVILFHDVHPAAREALPRIFGVLEGGAVQWIDCRNL